MLRNYVLIAWRNLRKNKVFSFINVLGLAAGMAASMLIMQYVSHELHYDRFHARAGDIYRVVNDRYQEGKRIQQGTITYPAVGPALQRDFAEVENHTRLMEGNDRFTLKAENQLFVETRTLFADNAFLRIFSFPLLAGDPRTALRENHTVVLSEELARKYFHPEGDRFGSVVGKRVYLDTDTEPFVVTGVLKQIPNHSLLQFDVLFSYQTLIPWMQDQADGSWGNSNFYHYLLLKPGTDYRQVEAKLPAFSQRHFQGSKVSGSEEKFYLQPLQRAHLYSTALEYEIGKTGDGKVVWTLLLIAFLVMAIAWINYVNLATTRAIERAREVGIRKAVGASKGQLVGQFLMESLLVNAAAMVFAVTLVQLSQPYFNDLAGENLSMRLLLGGGYGGGYTPLVLGAITAAGVLLSGAYPAFALSAYEPAKVLKGKLGHSGKGILLRKSLVVFQYTISIAMIAGTLAVYHQIRYMTGKDLGFRMDQTLVVYGPGLTRTDSAYIHRANGLKEEVKKLAGVKAAATSSMLPGDRWNRIFDLHLAGRTTEQKVSTSWLLVDYEFIPTFGIRVLAGRPFRLTDHQAAPGGETAVVINRKLAQLLGFAQVQAAINQKVSFHGGTMEIIGVVENFHQQSLREAFEPAMFMPGYRAGNFYSFKVRTDQLPQTIAQIRDAYRQFFPGNTFDYYFLDEKFNRQYRGEMTFGRLTVTFSLLTIFIACLGLFGLSVLATAQRTKEIGVRKVLGASEGSLLLLLSKDFIRLILLANVIAWPLAFLGIREWLYHYAFRIEISGWLFVLPALLVLVVALGTVGFQTLRAARANPVHSLRSE